METPTVTKVESIDIATSPQGAPVQRDERAETLADQLVTEVNAANRTIARLEEQVVSLQAQLAAVREAAESFQ